ncbi:hypothetical protein VKT23_020056 [Stygiomarasmius scandens]|uniref:Uncharacterized protein n=1 Tax=Marasmiellus scandens TaxID=2682957 RepID=A0ABR1IJT3_9AGAR
MRDGAWNRAVVKILAIWTNDLVDNTKGLSDRLSGSVDWAELFRCRFYDIFSDIQAARELGSPDLHAQITTRYEEKKDRSKRRRQLQRKFTTRQQICSIMRDHAQKIGKVQDVDFWTATLTAVNLLQDDGMSDEEAVYEDEEQVKVVKRVAFRHDDFTSLFRHVDATPREMKSLFNQGGRKPFRRVFSSESSQRSPPPNLPSTFFRPEYLDLMKKGLVSWVAVQGNSTLPIPKVDYDKGASITDSQRETLLSIDIPGPAQTVSESSSQHVISQIDICGPAQTVSEPPSQHVIPHIPGLAQTASEPSLQHVIPQPQQQENGYLPIPHGNSNVIQAVLKLLVEWAV